MSVSTPEKRDEQLCKKVMDENEIRRRLRKRGTGETSFGGALIPMRERDLNPNPGETKRRAESKMW